MSRALLDINVLLAIFDPDHTDHEVARRWIQTEVSQGWASCPITQNGFIRILSQPSYPSPISSGEAMDRLGEAANSAHHEFWPCDLSVLDMDLFDRSKIHGPRQVTDAYLLALATEREGRFVTFDQTVPIAAVSMATKANLVVLPSS